jgi:hypothetical protein
MYLAAYFPDDGQSKPASVAGIYKMRHETEVSARASIEAAAKAKPEQPFTAWILNEETGAVVCWTRYKPKPVVEWVDPIAIAMEGLFNPSKREG